MIGDPKEAGERVMNPADTVSEWVQRVRGQIEPFLSFAGDNAATMVNNLDWTASLSTIDFLRDIGKHFPVNRMLARDVVRSRLESGISYTEFSYVLLQSLDFLNLHRTHGVTLQFGGSDQWGNLTAGVELIRRTEGERVHAIATPLMTKSDGTKYGKTEGGALWLDPAMLSPYAFHQFWLNVEDEKVGELLRVFTFLSHEEIERIEAEHAEKPFLRLGQKTLADEVTTLVHGAEETAQAKAAAAALFGGGELVGAVGSHPRRRARGSGRRRGVHGRRLAGGRGPARRQRARGQPERGAADRGGGRCLPQQPAARGRRRPGLRRRPHRRLVARAEAWEEAFRRRPGGLRPASEAGPDHVWPGSRGPDLASARAVL